MTVDQQVRAWLHSYPGLIEGSSPGEVMALAHTISQIQCPVSDFQEAIWRYGFKVTQVRRIQGDASTKYISPKSTL